MRTITKFRDHRQRFNPDAEFVWRKRVMVSHTEGKKGHRKGIYADAGDDVDLSTLSGPGKLQRLWSSELIELKDFPVPATRMRRVGPQVENPPDGSIRPLNPRLAKLGGGWFEVTAPDGEKHKVRGREEADALVVQFDGGPSEVEAPPEVDVTPVETEEPAEDTEVPEEPEADDGEPAKE